jgi:hypothetical protein
MIPVLRILVLTLPLCAFQCKGPQVETVMATVFGADVAAKTALPDLVAPVMEDRSSVVPTVEVVALVTEPEVIVVPEPEVVLPPPCDSYVWRGRVFSCTGEWLYDL